MTFNTIKNNLKDLEKLFNTLKDKTNEGINFNPLEIPVSLEREERLLNEIENLKNKLIAQDNNKENNENKIITQDFALRESFKKEIENLKNLQLIENEKIKKYYETTIDDYKKTISNLKCNLKNIKGELNLLKGSIRMLCRTKPLEKGLSAGFVYSDSSVRFKKERFENNFEFDKVFHSSNSQYEVFKEVEDFVESVFDGYKVCLFAYGQTGSGKTYTMIGTPDNPGILGRSLDKINRLNNEYQNDGWIVQMKASCIEIYNEEIVDLLNESKEKIIITHSDGETNLKNCKEVISKGEDLVDLFKDGINKRIVGATMSNTLSSRSHTVFILKISLEKEGETRKGVLCLIDLAGSERLDKSKSEGKRLKETQNINRSLSCLGDVFTAILNKESFIPFRNSKLTYFLQSYLTGNSRVSMILNIAQELEHQNESICTLRFGCKVSECKLGKATRAIEKKINN